MGPKSSFSKMKNSIGSLVIEILGDLSTFYGWKSFDKKIEITNDFRNVNMSTLLTNIQELECAKKH